MSVRLCRPFVRWLVRVACLAGVARCGTEEPHALAAKHQLCWPHAGRLAISEWLANPAGPDAGREWFEVVNEGNEALCLNRAVVTVDSGFAVQSRELVGVGCLEPNGRWLLGDGSEASRARAGGLPVDVHLGALELPNTRARLALACRGQKLTEVSYGDVPAAGEAAGAVAPGPLSGRSTARVHRADGSARFCNVWAPKYDERDAGFPRGRKLGCRLCRDEAGLLREQRLPAPQDLRIRATDADPPGADRDREWLWLKNVGEGPVDLSGLSLEATVPSRRPRRLLLATHGCTPLEPGATVGLPVLGAAHGARMPHWQGPTLPNESACYRLLMGEAEVASQWVPAPQGHACMLP